MARSGSKKMSMQKTASLHHEKIARQQIHFQTSIVKAAVRIQYLLIYTLLDEFFSRRF